MNLANESDAIDSRISLIKRLIVINIMKTIQD